MRTPKKWQNSQPVDGGHQMEEEDNKMEIKKIKQYNNCTYK
jgi:hypothetical protein